MDFPIESISFSDREKRYYSEEFEQITSSQTIPLQDRMLSNFQLTNFLKQLRINDEDIKKIWDLVSQNRDSIRLPSFMAAMRLCSAQKQKKPITQENLRTEQQVLARKNRGKAGKPEEETKSTPQVTPPIIQPKSPLPVQQEPKAEVPVISLQVSQEINISKLGKFEEIRLDQDDEDFEKPNDSPVIEKPEPIPQSHITKEIINEEIEELDIDHIEKKNEELHKNAGNPEPSLDPKNQFKGLEPIQLVEPVHFKPQIKHHPHVNPSLEEPKNPSKRYQRVHSQSKKVKPELSQIPEEVTPPKFSSREGAITVDNPVLITSGWLGSTSYYLYTITTRISGKIITVKRRFSDLDWMHNQLLIKYKGFIIPSRPEKKILGKNEEKFIEERRLQMEKYLNMIAKHPILGNSSAFKTFAQTPNEKFEREKINAEGVDEYSEYTSIEDAFDKVFAHVQNKIQLILSQKIIPFSDEVNEIEENIVKLEAPIQAFSGSFSYWVQSVSESSKFICGMNVNQEFTERIKGVKGIVRDNVSTLKSLSFEVKEEQLRLEGLKEALNTYKGTVEECSKLQNLITRKLAKHKNSSNEDTKARYLSEIQSTQDLIDKYNKDLEEIEKNLVKENENFERSKSEHLEKTIDEIVSSQKKNYEKEMEYWAECLKSIG